MEGLVWKLVASLAVLAFGAVDAGVRAGVMETQPLEPTPFIVVAEFPHDPEAFTQGLAFTKKGGFFEGTGLYGESSLRKVDLESGEVLRRFDLEDEFFGEGITIYKGKLWQITWQEHEAFTYDRATFERLDEFTYKGEGWGLADRGRVLIMSNGSAVIRFRNPNNFKTKRKITVTENDEPVTNLNELEWIDGEIWANVWQTARVVRIDPSSGEVTGWIDVSELWEKERAADPNVDVPNGIAYWRAEDRLFVTGKLWHNVYEIELVET